MVKPLARTSAKVSPAMPLSGSASWIRRKFSTILSIRVLLHSVSLISSGSVGASGFGTWSQGSLNSAVVRKS